MSEHITCGTTSIAAPIDNVKEIVYGLSSVNSNTNKTGFQQQFEVCLHSGIFTRICLLIIFHQNLEKNSSSEQDFTYTEAVLPKNRSKNRHQKLLPRKNIDWFTCHYPLVNIADSTRVIIPQIDGKSYYINFCYIDVSIK